MVNLPDQQSKECFPTSAWNKSSTFNCWIFYNFWSLHYRSFSLSLFRSLFSFTVLHFIFCAQFYFIKSIELFNKIDANFAVCFSYVFVLISNVFVFCTHLLILFLPLRFKRESFLIIAAQIC